jgi:hypothetical protein
MKRILRSLAAAVICTIASAPLFGFVEDPAFEAYQPRILVTPDKLPVLSWQDPGVDTEIDPSELSNLNVCTPGVCSQTALDAEAAYYQILAGLIAYYDQYGRLVGTAQAPTLQTASTAYST